EGTASARQLLQGVASPVVAGTPRSSATVALGASAQHGPRIWVVNGDDDTVSVIDATSGSKLAEIKVGSRPRTVAIAPNGRAWVANQGSASLSVIDPEALSVSATIPMPRASQPYGVLVADDGSAFVTLEATGQVGKVAPAGS